MTTKVQLIYQQLRTKIQAGEYPAGSKLPSESEFCLQFEISRGTIRKVLELLAEDGLIHSLHGKGVYVLDTAQISFSFGNLVSFAEVSQDQKLSFATIVKSFERLPLSDELRSLTGFVDCNEAWQIRRVRQIENERIILDLNYLRTDLIAGLTAEVAQKSLYQYIEQQLSLKIGFARRAIQVESATAIDKANLDLQTFDLIVVVRNWVYLHSGELFEYTESRHRPDRFVFTEFVRRR